MSTPPPPVVAPVPPAGQPAQPGLSEPARVVDTFIAPRKTFEDLKVKSRWWSPYVISAVITVLFGIVAVQKIDIARFVQQQIERSPSAQKRMEQATPEQRERGIAIQATITKVAFYAYFVVILIGGVVIAAE